MVLGFERHNLKERIAVSDKKIEDLTKQIEEEEARTKEISNLEDYMKSDEYIEKIAREKAGLVKENEIVFKEAE